MKSYVRSLISENFLETGESAVPYVLLIHTVKRGKHWFCQGGLRPGNAEARALEDHETPQGHGKDLEDRFGCLPYAGFVEESSSRSVQGISRIASESTSRPEARVFGVILENSLQQVRQSNELVDTIARRFDRIPAEVLLDEQFREVLERLKKDILAEVEKQYAKHPSPPSAE